MGGLGNMSELLKNLDQSQKPDSGNNFSNLDNLMEIFKGGGDSKESKKEILKQLGESLKEIMGKKRDEEKKENQIQEEGGIGIYIVEGIIIFILIIILLLLIRRSVIKKKALKYEELQPRPLSASIPIE
jgi:hypothetical protein